jgi:transposase
MNKGDLSDEQWARLELLLPPRKPKTGRPNNPHRKVINGILWVLRCGAPWDEMPRRYGKHSTASSRYYRWRKNGIWGLFRHFGDDPSPRRPAPFALRD